MMLFIMSCAKKVAVSPAPLLTNEMAAAKETYEANCQRCHNLKKPANYTALEWPRLVDKMAPKAGISEEQKAAILNYVIAFAKK
jgi:nitrate/TMAO reductase-like tetraheme cytochrome c subunit